MFELYFKIILFPADLLMTAKPWLEKPVVVKEVKYEGWKAELMHAFKRATDITISVLPELFIVDERNKVLKCN